MIFLNDLLGIKLAKPRKTFATKLLLSCDALIHAVLLYTVVELHNIPERLTDFIDVAWKFDWKFTEFYLLVLFT